MVAAVEDDNPVIMIEHRWCQYVQVAVPEGYSKSDLTGPRRLREGSDATLVASSYLVLEAVRAAAALRDAGVEVEVFDDRKRVVEGQGGAGGVGLGGRSTN